MEISLRVIIVVIVILIIALVVITIAAGGFQRIIDIIFPMSEDQAILNQCRLECQQACLTCGNVCSGKSPTAANGYDGQVRIGESQKPCPAGFTCTC